MTTASLAEVVCIGGQLRNVPRDCSLVPDTDAAPVPIMVVWVYGSTGLTAWAMRLRTIEEPLWGRRFDMPPANITLAQAERVNWPGEQEDLDAWAKGSKWCCLD